MRSKLGYLYLTAGVFFAEKIFAISTPILQSWSFFCNPKLFGTPYYNDTCPTIESSSDLTFANKMTFASEVMILIAYFFQNVKNWLFSFRYFEVAEMLGRKDKSNEAHIRARKVTSKVTIGAVIVIFISFTT